MKKNASDLIGGIICSLVIVIGLILIIFVFESGADLSDRSTQLFIILCLLGIFTGFFFGFYWAPQKGQYPFKQIQNGKKFKVESIVFGFEKEPQFWGGMVIIFEGNLGRYIIDSVPGKLFKDNKPEIGKSYFKRDKETLWLVN